MEKHLAELIILAAKLKSDSDRARKETQKFDKMGFPVYCSTQPIIDNLGVACLLACKQLNVSTELATPLILLMTNSYDHALHWAVELTKKV